ncbi:MAG: YqgE/AlgH family protein [Sphingomonadaceae bacterium]|jgi:putative transcriptional regulator
MTVEPQYLAGKFLVAMPGMFDPRFEHSVSVMCVHDEHGALGIGIGHIREGIRFRELLEELDIDPGDAPDVPVHHGGPVEPGRGFILHSNDWGGTDTVEVHPLCSLSASVDILRAIAEGRGPSRWLIALGYAGWGGGQLEEEMHHHGWYVAEGRREILFDTKAEARWMATWRAEGIDPALLAPDTGHA